MATQNKPKRIAIYSQGGPWFGDWAELGTVGRAVSPRAERHVHFTMPAKYKDVSRYHCAFDLDLQDDGQVLLVQDLGSTCGTYLIQAEGTSEEQVGTEPVAILDPTTAIIRTGEHRLRFLERRREEDETHLAIVVETDPRWAREHALKELLLGAQDPYPCEELKKERAVARGVRKILGASAWNTLERIVRDLDDANNDLRRIVAELENERRQG